MEAVLYLSMILLRAESPVKWAVIQILHQTQAIGSLHVKKWAVTNTGNGSEKVSIKRKRSLSLTPLEAKSGGIKGENSQLQTCKRNYREMRTNPDNVIDKKTITEEH